MNNDKTKKILDLIYLAAGCPAYWADCLEAISNNIGAKSGMIGSDHLETGEHLGRFQFGMDTQFVKRLASDLRFCDLWTKSLTALRPEHFVTEKAFLLDQHADTTVFFLDVLKQIDVSHTIGTFVGERASIGTRIAFQRCSHLGPYSSTELSIMNRLLPHLQQAIALGALESPYSRFTELTLATIEQSLKPQFLLSRSGNTVAVSIGAEPFLQGDAVKIINGKLVIPELPPTQWQSAIESVFQLKDSNSQSKVTLQLTSNKNMISTIALTRVHMGFSIFAHVSVESKLDDQKQHIHCNLTPGELKVLRFLCQGINPDQIAKELERSPHTIRTQIKSIKIKLNVSTVEKLIVVGHFYDITGNKK